MAFHLTCRRINNPSTNLWLSSHQVSYVIISIFIPYLQVKLKLLIHFLVCTLRKASKIRDMAFCRVEDELLTTKLNRRLRYFLL